MSIGRVIRAIRIERGLTQEQLALEVGTATSNLSRIENGLRTPSLRLMQRLAQALGVTVSQLHQAAEDDQSLMTVPAAPRPGTPPRAMKEVMFSVAADVPPREEPPPAQAEAPCQDQALPQRKEREPREEPPSPAPPSSNEGLLSDSSLSALRLFRELSKDRQHLALEYLRMLRRMQAEYED